MNSMTAFGKGEASTKSKNITVEIKSVNHRFMDLKFRLPKIYLEVEALLEKRLKKDFLRGSFQINVNIEDNLENGQSLSLNQDLLKSYLTLEKHLFDDFEIKSDLTFSKVLALDNILEKSGKEEKDEIAAGILEAYEIAKEKLRDERKKEGLALKKDFLLRIGLIEESLKKIMAKEQELPQIYRDKLLKNLKDLNEGKEIDDERIILEVSMMADKSSICEETTRLLAHIESFKEKMEVNKEIGRSVDFLLQEINREVNTIGSKSGSLEITKEVVFLKSELEKIREQIQNIE